MHRPADSEISGRVVIAVCPSEITLPQVGVGGCYAEAEERQAASAKNRGRGVTVATTITGKAARSGSRGARGWVQDRQADRARRLDEGRGRMVSTTDRITAAIRGV